jgi:hypothetical protein
MHAASGISVNTARILTFSTLLFYTTVAPVFLKLYTKVIFTDFNAEQCNILHVRFRNLSYISLSTLIRYVRKMIKSVCPSVWH